MDKYFLKKYVLLAILCLLLTGLYAETGELEISPKLIFHNIGWNTLNSFTYNYGFNFIGAGLGTWGMIETGLDWKWRNTIYDNPWTANLSSPIMSVGGVLPAITPLVFYLTGKFAENEKTIVSAYALTQTLILTMAIQSPLKMITGRRDPGLVDNSYYSRIDNEDDFSGVFNWFNMDFFNGWPSGHTANAFSAAATLSEIYHDSIPVKIGVFTYAALIGIGVTFSAHWASEAVAGALVGYAIGKTVGMSYRKLLEGNDDRNHLSFYFTTNTAGVIIRY